MSRNKAEILRLRNTALQDRETGTLSMTVDTDEDALEGTSVSTAVDMQRLCRVCAQPCTAATSASLLSPNPTLVYQLLHYFGILLVEKDGLPNRICSICSNELDHWEQVKKNVTKGQDFLRNQLELRNKKKDEIEEDSDFEVFDENSSDDASYSPKQTRSRKKKYVNKKCKSSTFVDDETITVTVDPFNIMEEDEIYSCTVCSHSYRNYDKFMKHQDSHKTKSSIESTMRMSKKKTLSEIKTRPKRPHSPLNPFQCGLCPKKFNKSFTLGEHLQMHFKINKNLKILPCAHCNIVFRKISLIIQHQEKHVKNPNKKLSYSCKECGKEFLKYQNMKSHMVVHQDIKKFQCSHCDASFKYKSMLADHIERHHDGLVEKIDSSDTHEISSESTKPPTCGICLQYFSEFTDVKQHLKENHSVILESVYPCANCSTKCSSLTTLLSHISSKHILKNNASIRSYKCEICKRLFNDLESLNKHILKIHKNKTIHDCPFCKIIFPNIDSLTEHVSKNHPCKEKNVKKSVINVPKNCSDPLVLSKNSETIDVKISGYAPFEPIRSGSMSTKTSDLLANSNENGGAYPCGLCRERFESLDLFEAHIQDELSRLSHKQVPCGFCGAMFRKLTMLLSHTEKHIFCPEKLNNIQCKICLKKFHTRHNFNAHMQIHSEHKKFKCTLCNTFYRHKLSWKQHFVSRHKDYDGDENNALEIVPQVTTEQNEGNDQNVDTELNALIDSATNYSNDSELNELVGVTNRDMTTNNERKRNEEKTEHYSCDVCNKKFFTSQLIYNHYIQDHVTENQFYCPICPKLFDINDDLFIHLEAHAKIKKYFCPICDKGFKVRGSMLEHIPLHSMERTYQCELCTRNYRSRTSLYYHKRREHDGDTNRYMCEICSKQCMHKCELKRHIRCHTGEFPLHCNICNKGFVGPARLKEHQYTHTDIKPLHCLRCKKGFISKKHWRTHMRKICNVPEEDILYIRPRFAT